MVEAAQCYNHINVWNNIYFSDDMQCQLGLVHTHNDSCTLSSTIQLFFRFDLLATFDDVKHSILCCRLHWIKCIGCQHGHGKLP